MHGSLWVQVPRVFEARDRVKIYQFMTVKESPKYMYKNWAHLSQIWDVTKICEYGNLFVRNRLSNIVVWSVVNPLSTPAKQITIGVSTRRLWADDYRSFPVCTAYIILNLDIQNGISSTIFPYICLLLLKFRQSNIYKTNENHKQK